MELNFSSAASYLVTLGWFSNFSCFRFQICKMR